MRGVGVVGGSVCKDLRPHGKSRPLPWRTIDYTQKKALALRFVVWKGTQRQERQKRDWSVKDRE